MKVKDLLEILKRYRPELDVKVYSNHWGSSVDIQTVEESTEGLHIIIDYIST